jgi:hypothetical protein
VEPRIWIALAYGVIAALAYGGPCMAAGALGRFRWELGPPGRRIALGVAITLFVALGSTVIAAGAAIADVVSSRRDPMAALAIAAALIVAAASTRVLAIRLSGAWQAVESVLVGMTSVGSAIVVVLNGTSELERVFFLLAVGQALTLFLPSIIQGLLKLDWSQAPGSREEGLRAFRDKQRSDRIDRWR